MTMPITLTGATEKRIKMISAALKYKAPKKYSRLKKSKQLQAFLKQTEATLMEDYETAASRAVTWCDKERVKNESPLKAIQRLEMSLYEA